MAHNETHHHKQIPLHNELWLQTFHLDSNIDYYSFGLSFKDQKNEDYFYYYYYNDHYSYCETIIMIIIVTVRGMGLVAFCEYDNLSPSDLSNDSNCITLSCSYLSFLDFAECCCCYENGGVSRMADNNIRTS